MRFQHLDGVWDESDSIVGVYYKIQGNGITLITCGDHETAAFMEKRIDTFKTLDEAHVFLKRQSI